MSVHASPHPTAPVPSPSRMLISIVAALTILRVAALSVTGLELHGDEAQYWTWAQRLDWGYFTKPPLIAWLIAGATSVCGDASWCIRAPSAILHGLTALTLAWLAREVFRDPGHTGGHADDKAEWIGFWAGLIWILLPAVSWSSVLVSTDVPLLLCWSVFLAAFCRMRNQPGWMIVPIGGIALGLGLLAKYAMAYVLIGLVVHLIADRQVRTLLRDARLWAMLAIGALVLSPNILWNLQNEFATVRHLGDNANLKGELFQPLNALEFLGQQFGVFGPISFGIVLWRAVAWVRGEASPAERFLLAVSLPPLIVVTMQALLSRANANWAVTAVPASTVLVAGYLVLQAGPTLSRWLKGLIVIPHGIAALGLLAVVTLWPIWQPPYATKGLARLAGWETMANQLRPVLAQYPDLPLLIADRMNMAALLYTMRGELVAADRWLEGVPGRAVWAWDWNFCPEHHYEQTSRFDPDRAQPILLMTGWENPSSILQSFQVADPIGVYRVEAYGRTRTIRVYLMDRYQGHWSPPEDDHLPCEPPDGQGLLGQYDG